MTGLPLNTRFHLGDAISPEQAEFLDSHGFLVFEQVASAAEIAMLGSEMDRIEAQWLAEKRQAVYGIPLFWGRNPDGQAMLQRFAFTSQFSPGLRSFVRDPRFEAIRKLVGEDARIGDDEKDGVVINRYVNVPGSVAPRLGWHTDGLRDLFYGRMPQRMLNVGLHLDACTRDNGGLRLIPGSHTQGFFDMLLRKPYFVSHGEDRRELCIETQPGDLTVHDGRLWHRVAQSTRTGWPSLRRSMYVPYLTGPYEPKSDRSTTPAYHHLGRALRAMKRRLVRA
jgi:phytanoyl-CoA hydroxylase